MQVTDQSFNPSGDQRVDTIKRLTNELAAFIDANVQPGRRRSVALTQLETASMWAVKATVCGDE